MEEFVKQLTLIDYFGILIPGLIFNFALGMTWNDITAPVKNLFGENVIALFLYFLIISYLMGHALAQIAAMTEDVFWKTRFWRKIILPEDYFRGEDIKRAYAICFPDREFPSNSDQEAKVSGEIFRYIQKDRRPQRILVFSAFYTMSRALVIAFFLAMLLLIFENTGIFDLRKYMILSVALILLFFLRWIQFEKKGLEEARMLFIAMANENQD